MEKRQTEELFLPDTGCYIAHADSCTGRKQSLTEHLKNVLQLAEENCPLDILRNLVRVAASVHDSGKLCADFQAYMQDVLEKGEKAPKRQVDHATAGGRIVEMIGKDVLAAKMIATAIYAHHGLQDCVDLSTGRSLSEKRKEKEPEISFLEVVRRFAQMEDLTVLKDIFKAAHQDVQQLYAGIRKLTGQTEEKNKYGNEEFYLGMYERLLLSVLIDSDWSDAACFAENKPLPKRTSRERIQEIWAESIAHFEKYMTNSVRSGTVSPLNRYREEIAEMCGQAAQHPGRLYRLTVPTGAGKTLSSLRFALYHAQRYGRQHIFYAAPFNSILEQNAADIKRAVGNDSYVLEHHCNVIREDEEQEAVYKKLTESWDSPFVVTTAVQMLNTLFSGQKSSIRRMYSLCNSVIIFDEVQAIPAQCTELFYLAVNFLTECCNTTVVLCSATQPSLAALRENNLLPCREMAGDIRQYMEAFRRVEIEDQTERVPGGMSLEQLSDFAGEQLERYGTVLAVVNTKAAAKGLYQILRESGPAGCRLYHLSTDMCAAHRSKTISDMRSVLSEKKKQVICVSTQLIEAGVNLSFSCVIRSLSGLDSAVQAAGRCNRHKEMEDLGKVFLVRLSAEAEKTERMREVRTAGLVSEKFLYEYRKQEDTFEHSLDSLPSIKRYYELYYYALPEEETKYPVMLPELQVKSNLMDLLGEDKLGRGQYRRAHGGTHLKTPLGQAFRTAGDQFEVIREDQKLSVIIPYDEEAKRQIGRLESLHTTYEEQRAALRRLQRYAVGISPYKKEWLAQAARPVGKAEVLVWDMAYYDAQTGVTENRQDQFPEDCLQEGKWKSTEIQ
ncbi:MAG: CRISPR-associated helicase Cas3' [Eubacteriales bacterium]|nr:CRISPR-associated helicase Cas3' [Eubacteriales bacterium]